jgi:hypothetical protein
LIYGTIVDTSLNDKYFIAVLDKEYNVLFATDKYSSGTAFSQFVKLAYDEEGKVWGVDIYGTTTETGDGSTPRYRLLLLNNIAIPNQNDTYEVKLRKAYRFPIGYNKVEFEFMIDKVKGEPIYYILSNDYGMLNSQARVIIVEVNVGTTNDWYQATSNLGGISTQDDMLLKVEEDVYTMCYTSTANGHTDLIEWVKGTTPTRTYRISQEGSAITIIKPTTLSFIGYDGNNNWEFKIFDEGIIKQLDTGVLDTIGTGKTYYINGLIFYLMTYCSDDNTNTYKVVFGCYDGTNYNKVEEEFNNINVVEQQVNIKNNYSLYSMDAIFSISGSDDIIFNSKLTSYTNLYSGTPYNFYNSLIGQKGELYNSDNQLIFARQLYNLTTYNNTTTATIEVPNVFLNDSTIENKNLIGATSVELVNNNNSINKNIYEALYVNFINTITIASEEDMITTNPEAAIELTNAINSQNEDSTTMENIRIAKIRYNFQDSTSKIQTLNIENVFGNTYIGRSMTYIDREVDTVDILSNDETIVYATWEIGSSFTINTYNIYDQPFEII